MLSVSTDFLKICGWTEISNVRVNKLGKQVIGPLHLFLYTLYLCLLRAPDDWGISQSYFAAVISFFKKNRRYSNKITDIFKFFKVNRSFFPPVCLAALYSLYDMSNVIIISSSPSLHISEERERELFFLPRFFFRLGKLSRLLPSCDLTVLDLRPPFGRHKLWF